MSEILILKCSLKKLICILKSRFKKKIGSKYDTQRKSLIYWYIKINILQKKIVTKKFTMYYFYIILNNLI